MADTAPAAAPSQPASPGADQPKNSSEMKEDASKPEKWPFSEPQPIREDQVRNAVNFLLHPKVRGTPMVQRYSFLERKGLTREEIEEAFRRCPDAPTSEATKTVVSSEVKVPAVPAQPQSGGFHKAVVSAQPQPAQQYISGPLSAVVPARTGPNWSQLIVGAGLIAAAGAGTGYFFQQVLAPKLRTWLHRMLDEEKKSVESKGDGQGKGLKPTPLEDAVNAAAAAANAAAAAAAEVANISREVLKLQAEEWQHVKTLMKTLDSKTEELKSTLASMRTSSQDAQEHVVPHTHAEDTSYYKGTVKPYQRTSSPAEQIQMKQGVQVFQSMNGADRIQSNGHSTSFNSFMSESEDESWWRRKKVEVETYASPKQHMESTLQISEVEAGLDQEIGSTSLRTNTQNRGGPLGRQGWVPPPAPQTVMPGAASAIRYQKPATVDEAKRAVLSEEKEVDSRQPPPLLQTGLLDSASSMRLQNPVRFDEAKPRVVAEDPARLNEGKPNGVAEEKEMAAQSSFELSKMPQAAEVTEIASIDKEIPISLQGSVKVDEMRPNFGVEGRDMTSQTAFELPRVPSVARVTEITSMDKEIPSSSVEEWAGDGA